MNRLFANLTTEQQAGVLAYSGPENFGDPAFLYGSPSESKAKDALTTPTTTRTKTMKTVRKPTVKVDPRVAASKDANACKTGGGMMRF